MGVAASVPPSWSRFLQGLYDERSRLAFACSSHLCLSVNGSSHGKWDTLLGIAYSWENKQAAYTRIQRLQQGKDILSSEADLSEIAQQFAHRRRLERVAAYRQMQGVGHMVQQLLNKSIDDFELPADVCIAPVDDGEERVIFER